MKFRSADDRALIEGLADRPASEQSFLKKDGEKARRLSSLVPSGSTKEMQAKVAKAMALASEATGTFEKRRAR